MFHKILIPLDGSALAERALEPAYWLAEKLGGEVILPRVAVPEPMLVGLPHMAPRPYDLYDGKPRRDQEQAEAYLYSLKIGWLGRNVPIRTQVLSGAPPELIVEVANAEGVDLIVMSTHGRSGFNRLIYGSVAEAVLRGTHVPVLLIPLKT